MYFLYFLEIFPLNIPTPGDAQDNVAACVTGNMNLGCELGCKGVMKGAQTSENAFQCNIET